MRQRVTWWTIEALEKTGLQPPRGPWNSKVKANEAMILHYQRRLDRIEMKVARCRVIGPFKTNSDARLAWRMRQ